MRTIRARRVGCFDLSSFRRHRATLRAALPRRAAETSQSLACLSRLRLRRRRGRIRQELCERFHLTNRATRHGWAGITWDETRCGGSRHFPNLQRWYNSERAWSTSSSASGQTCCIKCRLTIVKGWYCGRALLTVEKQREGWHPRAPRHLRRIFKSPPHPLANTLAFI